ncbi:MAG: hypothetical protein WC594_12220 [Thermodesulfovibrionales bacterium]
MTNKENQSEEDKSTDNKPQDNKPFFNPKSDGLNTANCIQIAIAFILTVNLIVLYLNLDSLNHQIKLTEVLNQPLCGVKEIKINEVKDPINRIKIYAVITNSGNYSAKNASIEWEFYQCKDLIGDKPACNEKIKGWQSSPKNMNITILPKQEFNYFLIDVTKEELSKRVEGYDRGLRIKLTIKYKNMDNNPQQYSGSFLIIRVGAPNIYEATIEQSSIETKQETLSNLLKQLEEPLNPSTEAPNKSKNIPRNASPSVVDVPDKINNQGQRPVFDSPIAP